MNVKELISKITYNEGTFPEEEIKQLIENKEDAIPELLSVLEYTNEHIDLIIKDKNDYFAHIYAVYLLAQFREYKSYELIYKILLNSEDSIEMLFGDLITEGMGCILASVCNNNISLIKKLIENKNVYEYVRGAAINALVTLVANGNIERDEIIKYFSSLFNSKLEREDSFVWNKLVICAFDLYPDKLMNEIRETYNDNLVDESFITLNEFEKQLKLGEKSVLEVLRKDKNYTFIEDTIKELRGWASFNKSNKESYTYSSKIGRNDPCPCGSGKKYKKCCIN